MMMSLSVPAGAVSACQASASGIALAPMVILSTMAMTRAANRVARTTSRR